MTTPSPSTPPQTGWLATLAALAAFVIVPMVPSGLWAIMPITQTIVVLVAALATCAILGWWKGGNVWFAAVWVILLAWMLWSQVHHGSTFTLMANGWTLLLVACFGMASLLTPNQTFSVRALTAVGLAVCTSFVLVIMSSDGIDQVQLVMRGEFDRRVEQIVTELHQQTARPEFRALAKRFPVVDSAMTDNETKLREIPEKTTSLLPALLALESLAALALAWSVYHRLATVAIGPQFRQLREFRFNDQLIWGLAVGLTILFLPPFQEARNVGFNLLVFFGALYLLRGVGVLSWISRGRGVATILILLTAFATPLVVALALCVGVGDTWMDWRKKIQPAT